MRAIDLNEIRFRLSRFVSHPFNPASRYPLSHEGLRKSRAAIQRRAGNLAEPWERAGRDLVRANGGPRIDPDKGYLVLRADDVSESASAIAAGAANYPTQTIVDKVSNANKADTLLALNINIEDPINAAIKALALSPKILAPVADYLGCLPVLYSTQIWFSKNSQDHKLLGSQLYHFDREDARQVKAFIPIEEITTDTGPLTLIPAKESANLIEARRSRGLPLSLKQRFEDEEVHRYAGGTNSEVPVIGEAGDIILADTTNCLHYGSRPGRGSKYQLFLEFVSPFCPTLVNQGFDLSAGSGNVENMVLSYQRHRRSKNPG
jgi:hypothetical protein